MDEKKLKDVQKKCNIGGAIFGVASSVIGLVLAIIAKN